jgi:hypothetical protein
MAKINWKKDLVISIEVKDNLYVLAQMGEAPYLFVYTIFSKNEEWKDVDLAKAKVLFCNAVTRQFIGQSKVSKVKVAPVTQELPKYWIKSHAMGTHYRILWEGTPDETKVLLLGDNGGGSLIERDFTPFKYQEKIVTASIPSSDKKTIDSHELTNIRMFPELNERLYHCYKEDKNVDPLKDLIFDRPMPLEYKRYAEIIAGVKK